ncbi:hypothetical protein BDV12DRAFT_175934 [Aspergillus spectabilis]
MPPLAILALIPQTAQIWKDVGEPEVHPGLSVVGLVVQALVLGAVAGAVAGSWPWRVVYSERERRGFGITGG